MGIEVMNFSALCVYYFKQNYTTIVVPCILAWIRNYL